MPVERENVRVAREPLREGENVSSIGDATPKKSRWTRTRRGYMSRRNLFPASKRGGKEHSDPGWTYGFRNHDRRHSLADMMSPITTRTPQPSGGRIENPLRFARTTYSRCANKLAGAHYTLIC